MLFKNFMTAKINFLIINFKIILKTNSPKVLKKTLFPKIFLKILNFSFVSYDTQKRDKLNCLSLLYI